MVNGVRSGKLVAERLDPSLTVDQVLCNKLGRGPRMTGDR